MATAIRATRARFDPDDVALDRQVHLVGTGPPGLAPDEFVALPVLERLRRCGIDAVDVTVGDAVYGTASQSSASAPVRAAPARREPMLRTTDHAAKYATGGWQVWPIRPRSKRPHARARLGAILAFARRRGFVDRIVTELADGLLPDPVDQLPAVDRLRLKEANATTPDEFDAVLAAARDEGWCWEAALETLSFGLRRGELLGLCWDLVDLDGGTIAIGRQLTRISGTGRGHVEYAIADVKTDEALRVIPLHTEALTVLRRWRTTQSAQRLARGRFWERRDDRLDLVFTDDCGGFVTHDALRSTVARLCRRAGVRRLNPHKFRHGAASTALAAGASLQEVAGLLGHSDSTVTAKIYAHLLKAPSEATDALAASRRRKAVTA